MQEKSQLSLKQVNAIFAVVSFAVVIGYLVFAFAFMKPLHKKIDECITQMNAVQKTYDTQIKATLIAKRLSAQKIKYPELAVEANQKLAFNAVEAPFPQELIDFIASSRVDGIDDQVSYEDYNYELVNKDESWAVADDHLMTINVHATGTYQQIDRLLQNFYRDDTKCVRVTGYRLSLVQKDTTDRENPTFLTRADITVEVLYSINQANASARQAAAAAAKADDVSPEPSAEAGK